MFSPMYVHELLFHNELCRSIWCHSLYLGRKEHFQQGAHLSSFRSDDQQTCAFSKPLTSDSRWSHVPV
ncbi:hypothetical protein E2C01_034483 [Portunus trituberculatus]|uniref:Uncharacterized protein n=1 Tax=Portunus trituberculatus TaxID=210409 RepID=A0A5B7F6T7_PORTR|nr:hypothetical protein [Portunus trituberculatus]